jgi:hypothetical protein
LKKPPVWGKQAFSPNPILRYSAQDPVTRV